MNLRTAKSVRTWNTGETTEHFWIEIAPDRWLEVSPAPTSLAEADDFRARQAEKEKAGSFPLCAATRYITSFSDRYEFLSLP